MRRESRGSLAAAAVAVVLCGGLSVWLQAARDAMPVATSDSETLYLTERAAGRAVFTHRLLAADLYWIRAIQYFGSRSRVARVRQSEPFEPPPSLSSATPVSFDQLYSLLDIATTLDPRFNIAYRFGAIFLAAQYPEGPGRPDLAVALLEKGLRTSPEKWQYWHDIGFVHYWNSHDYRKASDAFRRGADLPGAPWWLRSLAATTLVKGGDREISRLLWRQLAETAENEDARHAANIKLMQLEAIGQIERLQSVVDAVAVRTKEPVTSWRNLLRLGAIRAVPRDPTGIEYDLQPSGRVTVSKQSSLMPLPVEPGSTPRQ
jgi:tetratricopeptide (TPR) repeat protein